MLTGANVYAIDALYGRHLHILTNTAPTSAYRGAGRPEAVYIVERLIDKAAQELGVDALDLRKRNLISSSQLPYRTATGSIFDSGDFAGLVDRVREASDWAASKLAALRPNSAAAFEASAPPFFLNYRVAARPRKTKSQCGSTNVAMSNFTPWLGRAVKGTKRSFRRWWLDGWVLIPTGSCSAAMIPTVLHGRKPCQRLAFCHASGQCIQDCFARNYSKGQSPRGRFA